MSLRDPITETGNVVRILEPAFQRGVHASFQERFDCFGRERFEHCIACGGEVLVHETGPGWPETCVIFVLGDVAHRDYIGAHRTYSGASLLR